MISKAPDLDIIGICYLTNISGSSQTRGLNTYKLRTMMSPIHKYGVNQKLSSGFSSLNLLELI